MANNEFGTLLRSLREEAGMKQKEVAERVGIDPSVLSRVESGQYPPPSRRIVQELGAALNLSPEKSDRLLEIAGHKPESILDIAGIDVHDPNVRAILHELAAVRRRKGREYSAAIEEAIFLLLRGSRSTDSDVILGILPTPPSEKAELLPKDAELDDLLTGVLTGEAAAGAVTQLLRELESHALDFELRRRIAEALPTLAELNAEAALRIATILRTDYHEERWHSDLGRRVVEAVPALFRHTPEAAALLTPAPRDQVYVAIGTVEALHAINLAADEKQRILSMLRQREEPEHVGVVDFLWGLLEEIAEGRAANALAAMRISRDRHRVFRTAVMRTLPRLFGSHPVEALSMMLHFHRRVEGQYAEHINVRRPLAMALPGLVALLGAEGEARAMAKCLILSLAQDQQRIMRRAVADDLPSIVEQDLSLARELCEHLTVDTDPYVRRRVWAMRARLTEHETG
jgi:transcriptional regulator with XRE-family HTH domain